MLLDLIAGTERLPLVLVQKQSANTYYPDKDGSSGKVRDLLEVLYCDGTQTFIESTSFVLG